MQNSLFQKKMRLPYRTLFLDRDGVINTRLVGKYVNKVEDFEFTPNALEAFQIFARHFKYIIIVTNQQGVGKGIMSQEDLDIIHENMLQQIRENNGIVHAVYAATGLTKDNPIDRKPNIGMALKAKLAFPDIDFEKSVMVGDSLSDMDFGKNINAELVYIAGKIEDKDKDIYALYPKIKVFASLWDYAQTL